MHILGLLCALAVACADVEAKIKRVVTIRGPVIASDSKIFRVRCRSTNCEIESIRTYGGSGNLYMWGEYRKYAPNGIDYEDDQFFSISSYGNPGTERTYRNRRISSKIFDIHMVPDNSFANVSLEVQLKNTGLSIWQLSPSGVSIQRRAGKKYVRIRSGYLRQKLSYFQHVKVTCNGNCRNVLFKLRNGQGRGNANLAASTLGLPLIHRKGCFYDNCYCTSNTAGNNDVCRPGSGGSSNVNSNVLYITLIPDPSFTDVVADFKADNIKSKEEILPWKIQLQDGSQVAVAQTPLRRGEHAHFALGCKLSKCKNLRFEIMAVGGPQQFSIRAGTKTQLIDGNCPQCDCNDLSSCGTQFNPRGLTPYITLKALADYDDYLYLRAYGDGMEHLYYTGGKSDPYAPFWG